MRRRDMNDPPTEWEEVMSREACKNGRLRI
jgi:hypothetical protein